METNNNLPNNLETNIINEELAGLLNLTGESSSVATVQNPEPPSAEISGDGSCTMEPQSHSGQTSHHSDVQ